MGSFDIICVRVNDKWHVGNDLTSALLDRTLLHLLILNLYLWIHMVFAELCATIYITLSLFTEFEIIFYDETVEFGQEW